MLFSVTRKKVKPNGAGENDGDPIQGTEKKTLDRVPVFVDTETAAFVRVVNAEKDKDAQRQAPAVPGQIGDDAVAEPLDASVFAAAEEYEQAGKVDRQPPCELQQIEQDSGPAGGGDCPVPMVFRLVHMKSLFRFYIVVDTFEAIV